MKWLQKYAYLILLTIVSLGILLLGFRNTSNLSLRFGIRTETGIEYSALYASGDDNYYVFLPSYAEMEDVMLVHSSAKKLKILDTDATDGLECSIFELNTPYPLSIGDRRIGEISFLRSGNVASMHIETSSGNMEEVHESKNNKETSVVTIYLPDGVCLQRDLNATIKGRGNATWGQPKKPYALMFDSAVDILGMGSGSNWILLANAFDETNLRNKLILEMAQKVGMSWAPEGEFVDLYLNGEYNGLYLLTEKVESGENRLPLNLENGDFLCKVDLESRMGSLNLPFQTVGGRTIEIAAPAAADELSLANIHARVNQLEQLIISGKDLADEPTFDLDSWVLRYLIDEISANIDADTASSYFYCVDGVFCAGPVWDYDKILGCDVRNENPHSFIARNLLKYGTERSTFYASLTKNPSFQIRSTEIFQETFWPILSEWINGGIEECAAQISDATKLNSLRWEQMFRSQHNPNMDNRNTAEALKNYLEDRVEFLASAWLEQIPYCTVQFQFSMYSTYWNISVERGSILKDTYFDVESTNWKDANTGEIFDPSQPITEDLILMDTSAESENDSIGIRGKLSLVTIAMLLLLLFILVASDMFLRWKERKMTNV